MSMRTVLSKGLLAASAAACLVTPAYAGGGEPGGLGASAADGPIRADAAAAPRKLLTTYSSTANGSGSPLAASTFNAVDSTTVNCTAFVGCFVGMESMVQLSTGGGDWAICFYLDGVAVNCPYQGVNGVGSFVVGNYRGISALVPKGLHTVEMRVFTNTAAGLYRWSVDYRVYKNAAN